MSVRLIAVVEDDEDDFFFTQRELRKHTADPIVRLANGRAAIDYLAGEGPYRNRAEFPLPDIMLLDLRMDDVSGFEVLDWVKRHPGIKGPKIYVLTGSNEPSDRERVKSGRTALAYFVKPLSPTQAERVLAA
jgi:CheY-like chemotaxis protein